MPVHVLRGDDEEAIAASVVINQVRERLSVRGELRALRHLIGLGLKPGAAGEALGKSRAWVQRMLKLDMLPEDLKDEVTGGEIGISHGLIMADYLDHPEVVEMLAELARSGQASGVPTVEALHNETPCSRRHVQAGRFLQAAEVGCQRSHDVGRGKLGGEREYGSYLRHEAIVAHTTGTDDPTTHLRGAARPPPPRPRTSG